MLITLISPHQHHTLPTLIRKFIATVKRPSSIASQRRRKRVIARYCVRPKTPLSSQKRAYKKLTSKRLRKRLISGGNCFVFSLPGSYRLLNSLKFPHLVVGEPSFRLTASYKFPRSLMFVASAR